MATWLYRIGNFAARRAWAVILTWTLVIAGVAGAYTAFHGKLSNTFTVPGTQTQQLSDELAQRFPSANRGSGQIILTTGDGTALTEEQKQAFSTALNKLTGEVSSVDAVTDPFTTTSKLAEAKTQLDEAHAKIDAAPAQIEDGKKQLSAAASQIEEGTKQIAENEKKLDDSQAQMRLGLPDASNYSSDSAAYKSYALVKDKFGEGMNAPLVAVAHTPANMSEEQAQQAQIDIASAVKERGGANVQAVVPGGMTDDRTLMIFQVIPAHSASSVETEELVHELRAVTVPVQGSEVSLGVAGQTSGNIDVSEVLAQKLPLYLGVVMGLSFLVLILVFRSILVPLVASMGFLFSVLASFGAVVSIYQLGFMSSLFGVDHPGPVLSFLPTLLIGILFGLAMDYQMFLVTGMREAYVHGKDAATAIVSGYNHAVRVVVAAAIIMISVFGGFIFAESTMIRPMGFGLAFGVLVDAFIVRMTLTPAIMALLGDKAWWMPKWLDRLTPNMDVEGAALSEKIQHERESAGAGSDNKLR